MRHRTPDARLFGALSLFLLAGCSAPAPRTSIDNPKPAHEQAVQREGYYVALSDGSRLPARVFVYTSGAPSQ